MNPSDAVPIPCYCAWMVSLRVRCPTCEAEDLQYKRFTESPVIALCSWCGTSMTLSLGEPQRADARSAIAPPPGVPVRPHEP